MGAAATVWTRPMRGMVERAVEANAVDAPYIKKEMVIKRPEMIR